MHKVTDKIIGLDKFMNSVCFSRVEEAGKNGLRYILLLFFFNCCLTSLALFIFPSMLLAASPRNDLSEIEEKLKAKKKLVKETIAQEKSILTEVEKINKTIRLKQTEIKDYEKRIVQAQSNISLLEDAISRLSDRLLKKRQTLTDHLKALYMHNYGSRALILISAQDYQDLIKKSRYINLLTFQDKKMITSFAGELNEANSRKRELEIVRRNLEISKENVLNKQKEMQTELANRDNLLASVRSKRSSYEKMIKELEESSEKLREMIERLEKAQGAKPQASTGFAALKGYLTWPVSGEVIIPFGKYSDPQYNIPVFKNGLEIKPRGGEKPKAVSNGTVVYADWFKGYGLLLIINHGSGYHTLYGHLSEIFHKTGDIINKGAVVGSIGESGVLNVPTLYFEIRYKGKPVDPMQWLKKNNSKNGR